MASIANWPDCRQLLLLAGCLCLLMAIHPNSGRADERAGNRDPVVLQARLEGETITPIVARFLRRAVREAEEQGAECLVIVLDTPGGLVDSTRAIVQEFLGSRTCIVVYVAPPGAQAASAGVFVTLAAHVAAMSPATTIGAAHPVQVGGLPTSPDDDEGGRTALEEKIVNSTVAWARGLAELRGRNAEWAARAVEESVTATEAEALKADVIDLLADDVPELLDKLDGRRVELADRTVVLRTAGPRRLETFEMWWGERLLAWIANPNVAFLLMIIGFYGILFELYSPGWGVAGTAGIVCLALAFSALALLPVNAVGLVLLGVGLALFVAEVFATSYGTLALGGAAAFTIGALMLVDSPAGFARVSLAVVLPVAAATAAITVFLVTGVVRAHRRKVETGSEALAGAAAAAIEDFSRREGRYTGTVRVHGELWKAVSDAPVAQGQAVRVRGRDGLVLSVEPEDRIGAK